MSRFQVIQALREYVSATDWPPYELTDARPNCFPSSGADDPEWIGSFAARGQILPYRLGQRELVDKFTTTLIISCGVAGQSVEQAEDRLDAITNAIIRRLAAKPRLTLADDVLPTFSGLYVDGGFVTQIEALSQGYAGRATLTLSGTLFTTI